MDSNNDSGLIIQTREAQAIANYLVTRPWGEVNGLLMILQQLRPAIVNQPVEDPKEE